MHIKNLYKLGLAAFTALALLVMGCENPTVWNEDSEARSVRAGAATIANVTIAGTIDTEISPATVTITLDSDSFTVTVTTPPTDVTSWFNMPTGLKAEVTGISGDNDEIATITVTGKPTAVSSFYIRGTIPGTDLASGYPSTITVNPSALYDILWPYSNWSNSAVFPAPDGAVNCSAYGNVRGTETFVVGSRRTGEVAYSTNNGQSWTIVSVWNTGDWVSSLAYFDDKFYAGGDNGMFASSPDGITWTPWSANILYGSDIRTIAYGNGVTIIGGTNGKAMWTTGSPTATSSWTDITGFSTTGTFNSIAFGADTDDTPLFVITGQGALSGFSYDGKSWTDTSTQTKGIFPPSGSQSSIKMAAYDPINHKFVIVGFHEAAFVVPTPSDFTWVPVDLTDIMGSTARTAWLNCVTFAGGYFVAGGSNGQTISSTDGINWAVTGVMGQFPAPTTDIPFANSVAYNPDSNIYLVGGGFDDGPGIAVYN